MGLAVNPFDLVLLIHDSLRTLDLFCAERRHGRCELRHAVDHAFNTTRRPGDYYDLTSRQRWTIIVDYCGLSLSIYGAVNAALHYLDIEVQCVVLGAHVVHKYLS